jgi:hypothetical protein
MEKVTPIFRAWYACTFSIYSSLNIAKFSLSSSILNEIFGARVTLEGHEFLYFLISIDEQPETGYESIVLAVFLEPSYKEYLLNLHSSCPLYIGIFRDGLKPTCLTASALALIIQAS